MQIDTEIGNESDGYRLTEGGYSGMPIDTEIGNESDGYRLTVVVFSGNADRY